MPNAIYLITNREILDSKRGFDKFGKTLNSLGANELRMAKIERTGRRYTVRILEEPDREKMAGGAAEPPSKKAAREIFDALQSAGRTNARRRDLLLFVHGFNNDVEDVIERAFALRQLYGVEVVAFSWPANGGGITGVASYKSDKRDAKASAGALDRVLEKAHEYVDEFRRDEVERLRLRLRAAHPDNPERVEQLLARQARRDCPFRISLMCHSMGNYLFKALLQSSVMNARKLIFDNVVLVAADTNNAGHREWIDRIQARNRVYVTINEDDSALSKSRMKGGDEQLARLGHYPYNLDSRQTVYMNFTNASHVGDSHAYFEGRPVDNSRVRRFFRDAFHGATAEDPSRYDAARNLYSV